MPSDSSRGIPRRAFVKSAVAIGGTAALSACMEREQSLLGDSETTDDGPQFPRGSPDSLPEGQHEWNDYLVRDAHGNTVPSQQQVLLGLSYDGSTPPTDDERERVENSLRTLERAFQWGTGGDPSATFNRGLLSMLSYAPSYFEAVGEVPESLVPPREVLEAVGEDPAKTDGFDALLVLTSDIGSVVLAAEAALFGEAETVNGVEVDATLEGVFSREKRRTGVAGKGIPADELDVEGIPEQAPLSMGFKSGFTDSLPSEEGVTLSEGPLAGGTTLAASRLHIDLERWYEQDHGERTAEMFCPAHDPKEVGETGSGLGNDSGIDEEDVASIPEHAERYGRVGHAQKVARARDDEFKPRMLRRSEGVATDVPDGADFNFTSVQRTFDAFVDARAAMNVEEYDVDVPAEDHGIVDYLETVDRGTYLVPSRAQRALPVV